MTSLDMSRRTKDDITFRFIRHDKMLDTKSSVNGKLVGFQSHSGCEECYCP